MNEDEQISRGCDHDNDADNNDDNDTEDDDRDYDQKDGSMR